MSNFDYIMALNTIAGRSYNDLCQVMFALTGNFHRHACPEYDSILSIFVIVVYYGSLSSRDVCFFLV